VSLPADTLTTAARVMGDATRSAGMTPEQAAEFFHSWHEFYLLAGTAAVTLVGLLFVALSFNLDVLIHSSQAHVLAHARSTLLTFSYVLVVSLGVLIPYQTPLRLGVFIAVASAVVGAVHIRSALASLGHSTLRFERSMRRRNMIFLAGYALAVFTGVAMMVLRVPQLLFSLITVICMLLGNGMGVAWDLLVEVGKLKAEQARETAESK
jgi:hypothetical protein